MDQNSTANSPVPMRILSFNGATFSGAASAVYKNVLIDLKNLREKGELTFSSININDDINDSQNITFVVRGRNRLLIDDRYTVFADDSRVVSPGGPFVTIDLFTMRFAGNKYVRVPSLGGVLKRDGGGKEQPFQTGADGETRIVLDHLGDTGVVAVVTGPNGEKLEMPIPLPIKGAEKGLVTQSVYLHFEKPK